MPEALTRRCQIQELDKRQIGRDMEIRIGSHIVRLHKFAAEPFFADDLPEEIALDADVDPDILNKLLSIVYGNPPATPPSNEKKEYFRIAAALQLNLFFDDTFGANPPYEEMKIEWPQDLTIIYKSQKQTFSSLKLSLTSNYFCSSPPKIDCSDLFSLADDEFWSLIQFLNSASDLTLTKNNVLRYLAAADHFHCQQLVRDCWSLVLDPELFPALEAPHLFMDFFHSCTERELKYILDRNTVYLSYVPDDLNPVPLQLDKVVLLSNVINTNFLFQCLKLMPPTMVKPTALRRILHDSKPPSHFKLLLLELLVPNPDLEDQIADYLTKNVHLLKTTNSEHLWKLVLNQQRNSNSIARTLSSMDQKNCQPLL
ncbi:hypothetical protein GEMRC1_007052 [Eukaryota sp. GEM-RC1]